MLATEIERLNRLKRLIIRAVFSDDELMERLTLKGGNAVDLIHNAAQRASLDLDFSLSSDLPFSDIKTMRARFETALRSTLEPEGFHAFDVRLRRRPPEVSPVLQDFWGGTSWSSN